MPLMLAGIVVGVGFFAAAIWSFAQMFRARDSLRIVHSAALILSLGMMGALSLSQPMVAAVAGALLVGAGLVAVLLERGFARFFPAAQIALGAAVAAGLPFTA